MTPSARPSRPPLHVAAAILWVLASSAACSSSRATAQGAPLPSSAGGTATSTLETLVAPIALYPDPLVADILAASTYPVQVVEASRDTANGAKPTASQMSQWDASVQALIEFPTVLSMMSNQLDWTTQLGQAVAQSQANVMAAIQQVRAEAQKAGNLQTNDKQTVTTQGSTIIIQPANPQVIYVPQYNPVTILEPAPAYALAPYGYGMMTFGVGFAAGAMTAYACDWGHSSINVNNNYNYNNVNNYNHNTNVNAQKYSSWKAPTNVGHITTAPPPSTAPHGGAGGAHGYGSGDDHAGSYGSGAHTGDDRGFGGSSGGFGGDRGGGMFGGGTGDGWGARAASDRGAQSLGDGGFGRGFGGFRGGGGDFHGGGHPRF